MEVICKSTGNKIDKKTAYSIVLPTHSRSSYFTSEDEYNKWVKTNQSLENISVLYNKILGVNKHASSSIFKKKLEIWLKEFTCFEIEFCLSHFGAEISQYRKKEQPYIVQVIENKLVQAREIMRLCHKKSPNYIELDYEMESKINNYKYNRKGCDITKWI
jgi:hypothetical protein